MTVFYRRESPWKVDGELTGISSKLKLLEQELLNLERVSKADLLKVPSQMRKQAKRYQALAGKIDDLCRRMVKTFTFDHFAMHAAEPALVYWQQSSISYQKFMFSTQIKFSVTS